MKVLMLESSGWGGICHYSHCLAQALAEGGVSLTLVTNEVYELRNAERRYEILPVLADEGSYVERSRLFLNILRSESPDVLHIQSGFSARRDWLTFSLFRKHCDRLLLTAHNVLPHDDREKNAAGMKFSLGRIYHSCDGIIAHSRYSKNLLLQTFGLAEERVAVIPHGNYLFFSRGNGNGNGNGNGRGRGDVGSSVTRRGPEVILFFGLLREYKGVDVLIRAFARVRARRENAVLVIAGKEQPGLLERYRRIIEEEGVAGSVILKSGYASAPEMSELFTQADLVALPYRESDGSGAVQLAYSYGKPIVASSVGVMPEIVEDGINGYLVPPDDPEALAESIVRFFELPVFESEKMGKMSRLYAERMYGWDMIAEMTWEFYQRASRKLEREGV